jgi:hypothetical protein
MARGRANKSRSCEFMAMVIVSRNVYISAGALYEGTRLYQINLTQYLNYHLSNSTTTYNFIHLSICKTCNH